MTTKKRQKRRLKKRDPLPNPRARYIKSAVAAINSDADAKITAAFFKASSRRKPKKGLTVAMVEKAKRIFLENLK